MLSPYYVMIGIFAMIWLPCYQSQKFNIFKSYKDAAVKPDNYGKVIQRDHPVTEYLDSKQLKMLRERTGPTTSENAFDNHWSGFKDKSVLAQIKQKKAGAGRNRKMRRVKKNDGEDGESEEGSTRRTRRLTGTRFAFWPFTTNQESEVTIEQTSYFQLPTFIEGKSHQNLFFQFLFGLLLSSVVGVTAYLVYKTLFRSKRSTSVTVSASSMTPSTNTLSSHTSPFFAVPPAATSKKLKQEAEI